jgi:hypothetical protein
MQKLFQRVAKIIVPIHGSVTGVKMRYRGKILKIISPPRQLRRVFACRAIGSMKPGKGKGR